MKCNLAHQWILICGLYVAALSSLFALTRRIIGDESHHLVAAQAVYSGLRMYREVWVNNMPGFHYVYGAIQAIWGPSFYLGRFMSVALGVVTFILCVKTCRIIADEWGARIGATLFAFNWVLANHYAAAYSPALTALYLTASAYFLFKGESIGCRLAAVLLADLAVCTRALVFPITAVVNVYVLLARRDFRWLVLLVALLVPFLFYLGFIHDQAEYFLFANLHWNKGVFNAVVNGQADLDRAIAALPGLGKMIVGKAADMTLRENAFATGFLYFPVAVLSVPLVYVWFRARREGSLPGPSWCSLPGMKLFLVLAAGLTGFVLATILFVGLLTPSGVPSYQTPAYPLFIILCVYAYQAMSELWPKWQSNVKLLAGVAVAVAAVGYGLPNVAYMSGVRNIEGKGLTLPLNAIREVALFIKERSDPKDEVLTDRPFFVYEAERRAHLGFWMTYFSYAPRWSTSMAERYHLVNPAMIRHSLEARAPKFVIRYPDQSNERDPVTFAALYSEHPEEVFRSFEAGYERVAVFPAVGKQGEGAVIYGRREVKS